MKASHQKEIAGFTKGKSEHGLLLLDHFITSFEGLGEISLLTTKTMIGISNGTKRIAWITQIGKNFIHVVFPFKKSYDDNLCFQKIAQVPGDSQQFNHHFRMLFKEDVNTEVLKFMKLAYKAD